MTPANTAHRATQSDLFTNLTKVGFIGYGMLHLALAWVAAQIAFGKGGQEGDQSGAFQKLAEQPFGKVLLWFVLICLVALAVCRPPSRSGVTATCAARSGSGSGSPRPPAS